jgi:hypothetical protein
MLTVPASNFTLLPKAYSSHSSQQLPAEQAVAYHPRIASAETREAPPLRFTSNAKGEPKLLLARIEPVSPTREHITRRSTA